MSRCSDAVHAPIRVVFSLYITYPFRSRTRSIASRNTATAQNVETRNSRTQAVFHFHFHFLSHDSSVLRFCHRHRRSSEVTSRHFESVPSQDCGLTRWDVPGEDARENGRQNVPDRHSRATRSKSVDATRAR